MLQIFYIAISIVYAITISYQIFQQFLCKLHKYVFISVNISSIIVCMLVVIDIALPQYIFIILWAFIMLIQLYMLFNFTLYKSIYFAIVLVFQLFAFTSIIDNLQVVFSLLGIITKPSNVIQIAITVVCFFLLLKCNFIQKIDEVYTNKTYRRIIFYWIMGFNIVFIFVILSNHIYYVFWMNRMFYISLTIIFILGAFVLLQHMKISLSLEHAYYEIDILKHQNEHQNRANNQQKEYIKNLRKLKHDMSNQLKSISYMIQDESYTKAQVYIEEINQKLVDVSKQYSMFCDHRLLDNVFQHMNTICLEKKISFSAVLRIGKINVNDHELYILLSHYFESIMQRFEQYQILPYAIQIQGKYNQNWLVINLESSMHQIIALKQYDEVNDLPEEIKNVVEKLGAFITNDVDEKNKVIKTILLIPIQPVV